MPTVLLVRHGENQYVAKGRLAGRKQGVHLNDRGIKQADALAEALAKVPIRAVYASPLERCMQTAEPIAQALGLEVIPEPGLMEVDFGDWQDKTLKQLRRRKLWKSVQHNPSRVRFPEGETFADAQLRIVKAVESLCAAHKPKDIIVCVSHSDIIKLVAAYYLGVPLDLFQRLTIAPASITTLHLGEETTRLLSINHGTSLHIPQPEKKRKKKAKH
jgi:probable phosphoglycerate mutase